MKVGIVGCGNVTRSFHLPSYVGLKDVEVVAVADPDKRSLNYVAEKYAIKNRYNSLSAMLEQHDLDFVDIATPSFTHYNLCSEAIDSNMNVLVEKPFVLSAEQALTLKYKSEKRNVKVGVIQNFRFRDPFIKLRAMQKEGKIGDIRTIFVGYHGLNIFGNPSWQWDEKLSGGILYDQGIHAVDILSWLMGENQTILGIDSHYEKSINMTTSFVALVKDEKGCVGIIDFMWLAPSWFFQANISATITDAFIKLFPDVVGFQQGEWGPLIEAASDFERILKLGKLLLKGKALTLEPHQRIISNFVSSVKKDKKPLITIDDVIPTLKLMDQIKEKITQT